MVAEWLKCWNSPCDDRKVPGSIPDVIKEPPSKLGPKCPLNLVSKVPTAQGNNVDEGFALCQLRCCTLYLTGLNLQGLMTVLKLFSKEIKNRNEIDHVNM